MLDWSRLKFLHPARVLAGLRRRGGVNPTALRRASAQGVRKLGTALDRALVGPMLLRINPMGYVCNHACPMCWLQHLEPDELSTQKKVDRDEGMKLADYERLFDSMPPGLEEVNLVGGGEPLVHPQCIQIMAAVKRHGWFGSLISNGSLLRETQARALVDMRWDLTRISVHAGDPETYRLIQGVDHYATVVENLKRYTRLRRAAAGAGGRLTVFHVIQRENLGHIDRLFAMAEEVGADDIVFEKIIPYDQDKILTADEVRRAREAILACAATSKIPCNLEDLIPDFVNEERSLAEGKPWVPARRCSVGFDQAYITALGDVLPCCFSNEVMGNLRAERFDAIWNAPPYRDFRARLNHGKFAPYCIVNRCTMKGVLHN